MGLLSPALANNWKRTILLGLGLLACAEAPPVERPPTVLGRVGDSEINERDFGLALEKLPDASAVTWRAYGAGLLRRRP